MFKMFKAVKMFKALEDVQDVQGRQDVQGVHCVKCLECLEHLPKHSSSSYRVTHFLIDSREFTAKIRGWLWVQPSVRCTSCFSMQCRAPSSRAVPVEEACLRGGPRAMTPKEVLALIREKEVKAVDLRFMDFPGLWQHFTIPAEALDEAVFEEGRGFDGSSIRGWQAINESDMLVLPVADTAFIDPFCKDRTLTLICNIQDPL